MTRKLLALTLSILSILGGTTLTSDAQGSYPSGQRWRGFPMNIGRDWRNNQDAMKKSSWQALKDRKCNVIRVCVVTPAAGQQDLRYDMPALFRILDACEKNARELGMSMVINYHSVGEFEKETKFWRLHRFWRNVAPRYKGKRHVHYEICNEPCFSVGRYTNSTVRWGLMEAYRIARDNSNGNGLLMFTFNGLNYNVFQIYKNYRDWAARPENNKWRFAWWRTGVAWHFYSPTEDNVSDFWDSFWQLEQIKKENRTICTETFTDENPPPRYVPENVDTIRLMETRNQIKQSWIAWRGWNETSIFRWKNIRNRANKGGYSW